MSTPEAPGGQPPYQGQPPYPQQPPQYQQPPQQQYQQPPQQSGGGPGFQDRAGQVVDRHIKTPETKEFFKTSEFAVWLLTILGILLAALISENLFSNLAWSLITALSFAYILSRGIAKAGTKRGYGDSAMDQ